MSHFWPVGFMVLLALCFANAGRMRGWWERERRRRAALRGWEARRLREADADAERVLKQEAQRDAARAAAERKLRQ